MLRGRSVCCVYNTRQTGTVLGYTRRLETRRDITAKTVSGKDMTRILERRNWVLLRVNGSHHFYQSPDGVSRLCIPVHGNQDLKPGLQCTIMKEAGLTDDDL